jgi:biotin-dependent carboxylase-like uncharacterized protein
VTADCFVVERPGVLTLIQDAGRYGFHRQGLTTGGPADPLAFYWANRLCGNARGATCLEVTVGGLVLQARVATRLSVCGADMPLTINQQNRALWQSHPIKAGDKIELGFARSGLRAYLAVAGGLQIPAVFGSTATVPREGIGGLRGGPLQAGDRLPCESLAAGDCLRLPAGYRPVYGNKLLLRVVTGYQHDDFPEQQRRLFFNSEYRLSIQSDRMGCRLQGPAISPGGEGIASEGICLGAIQIPPDGQPIVLMHDRQTIGGYPKLGAVIAMDLARLAQLKPGGSVSFTAVTVEQARQINLLAAESREQLQPDICQP